MPGRATPAEPRAAHVGQRARDDPARRDVPALDRSPRWAGARRSCASAIDVGSACSWGATSSDASCRASSTSRATATRRKCGWRSSTRCNARSEEATSTSPCWSEMRCSRVCTSWCRRRAATRRSSTRPRSSPSSRAIARGWPDELRDALVAAHGEEAGVDTFRIWRDAFPPGYQADVSPEQAVADIAVLEEGDDLAIRLQSAPADDGVARLKLYRSGAPLLLSDVMPVLEHLDVIVVDERPYVISPAGDAPRWIYSFGVRAASGDALADPGAQARVSELFLGVWAGEIENDGLNRLVLRVGLTARQVVVLRALVKYLHQAGLRFTEASFADALAANPASARRIVDLFEARFDLALADPERATAHRRNRRELSARSTRWRASTRTVSSARSSKWSERRCVRTRAARAAWRCRSSSTPVCSRSFPRRGRSTRSGCTRRVSKPCTCAVVTSHAVASGGRTGATTSAPRSSD